MSKEAALGCGVQTAHLQLRAAGKPVDPENLVGRPDRRKKGR